MFRRRSSFSSAAFSARSWRFDGLAPSAGGWIHVPRPADDVKKKKKRRRRHEEEVLLLAAL